MPKIMDELQEEELQDSDTEEIIEDAPPIEEDIEDDEYSVDPTLSIKQKILLIAGGFFAFLVFLILLFPLEEFLRSAISKASSQKGYYLDFKKLKIPIFGSKTIDSFILQIPDGVGIKTEEIEVNASIFSIIQGSFFGSIQANSIKLDKKDISVNIKSLLFEGKITGLSDEINELNGNLLVQATNGNIAKIPEIPLIGELKDTTIKNISIILKIRNGKFQIEKGVLDTSIGKISFKGKIDYTGSFGNSRIDLEVCPRLSASFSAERPDLSGMLQVVSKGNPDFCIPVQGTFNQPKTSLSLTGDSQSPPSSPEIGMPPNASGQKNPNPPVPTPQIPKSPMNK